MDSDWDPVEPRGSQVASPLGAGPTSKRNSGEGGVSANQVPSLVAGQLRTLVVDMRRRLSTRPTATKRVAMLRDVARVCVLLPQD